MSLHGAAALLLITAGAAKLARPLSTARLLGVLMPRIDPGGGRRKAEVADTPLITGSVRTLGCAEVAVGVGAIAAGGLASAAVGALYLCFAAVVARSLRAGAESCGCFGLAETPPSRIHVVGNICCAAVSLAAATGTGKSPAGVVSAVGSAQPVTAVALALAALALAGLILVAFTALPEALRARSAPSSQVAVFDAAPGSLRHLADPLQSAGKHG